jgi:putative membrane protein
MNRRNILAGLAAVSVLPIAGPLTGTASAQTRIEPSKLKALQGGDFATATSKLARTRARNGMVRTFAALEIEEQAAVAKAFGARPGQAGVDARHQAMLEELASARGASFDRLYVETQIKGHQELLAIHQRYARSGTDPMARGASIVGVTGIESHLAMLKTIRSMLG